MSLLAIKGHMMQVKMASLSSLCTLFNVDAECMRCMLEHWVRKGKIKQCLKKPACGTKCFGCPAAVNGASEMYEWVTS